MEMIIVIGILINGWVCSGILSYILCKKYMMARFPTLLWTKQDRDFNLVLSALGPLTLLIILFITFISLDGDKPTKW